MEDPRHDGRKRVWSIGSMFRGSDAAVWDGLPAPLRGPAGAGIVGLVLLFYLGLSQIDLLQRACDLGMQRGVLLFGRIVPALFCLGLGGFLVSVRASMQLREEVWRRMQSEAEADQIARLDALTGLPNRRVLTEEIATHLAALTPGQQAALVIVDLDRFKSVNDLHGHSIGDDLLRIAAERLAAVCGTAYRLVRLGGDEFAVFMPHVATRQEAARLADAICARVAWPFKLREGGAHGSGVQIDVQIGATAGIAMAPDDGADLASLLRAADVAMYQAKAARRGGHAFFAAEADSRQNRRTELRSELRRAIAGREIVPFFQPLVDLATGQVVGFETLARWQHPMLGLLPPGEFIELVEEAQLMPRFTDSLLRQASRIAAGWDQAHFIALNVSPTLLLDPDLVNRITLILRESGLPAGRLEVEITEDVLVSDFAAAQRAIGGLRSAGIKVALDDFGIGHSSLSLLRQVTIDKIKVDKSFFQPDRLAPADLLYIRAILNIGQALGVAMTAEGIETEHTWRVVAGLGCTFGQGYFFGRPSPDVTGVARVLPAAAVLPLDEVALTAGARLTPARTVSMAG